MPEVIEISLETAQATPTGIELTYASAPSIHVDVIKQADQLIDISFANIGPKGDPGDGGSGGGAVDSVNGHTGTVVLVASDVGADASGTAITAQTNAETYADSLASNYDPVGAASTAQSNAEGYTDSAVAGLVPATRTVNGHALSANVTVTKTDLSIGNVDNTSDANKPVSTAQQTALDLKVDKVTGKVLSTNDYTDAEKTKLAGIEDGATNVTALSDLTDDSTHRLVTDSEKTTWNGKQDALGFTAVPNTRTVNGHALSADVTVSKSDVGLGSVANSDTTTTANITDSTNKRFITDAELTVLGNTSGINTGDNATNSQYSGLAASKVATTRNIATTAPITGGGDLSADRTIAMAKATASVDGYLSAADFAIFNNSLWHGIIQAATYTLTSQTASQKLFNVDNGSGAGTLTLVASTAYEFECQFYLSSMSATSGSLGFDLLGAGTATFTSVHYGAVGRDSTADVAAGAISGGYQTTSASQANFVGAASGTGAWALIRGIVRINGGGTIIPSVTLQTAAAAVLAIDSYFKYKILGTSSVTTF